MHIRFRVYIPWTFFHTGEYLLQNIRLFANIRKSWGESKSEYSLANVRRHANITRYGNEESVETEANTYIPYHTCRLVKLVQPDDSVKKSYTVAEKCWQEPATQPSYIEGVPQNRECPTRPISPKKSSGKRAGKWFYLFLQKRKRRYEIIITGSHIHRTRTFSTKNSALFLNIKNEYSSYYFIIIEHIS
jgi:hypothetical protein